MTRKFKITIFTFILAIFFVAGICIFFDQSVFVRKNTIFRGTVSSKIVALTFDDGPSLEWTPKILEELKKTGVHATFFMIGKHVKQYPDIARRVVKEGHEIGNHSYDHHGIFYYTKEELYKEVFDTEEIIKEVTGVSTIYFRPPKAWITNDEKKWLNDEGYQVILWTLNSKDWVTFDDKYMVKYIVRNIKPGDIILFHDSGGVFSTEGGDRHETVKMIPRLVKELTCRGYRFVTISELLKEQGNNE